MSTKEQDFKQRFAAIMRDLSNSGSKDREAMWWIGSLAARMIDRAGQQSWRAMKASLSPLDHSNLLSELQRTGNKLHAEGKTRKAYAVQAVAVSMVAPTQKDAEVLAGNDLLDEMIEQNVKFFRQNRHLETQLN